MNESEVKKIAHLARIDLSEEETSRLKKDFADILKHIKKIDELKLEDVEPVSHPLNIKNVFREDEVVPSLGAKALLKNAPSSGRDMIRVPKIIEDKS